MTPMARVQVLAAIASALCLSACVAPHLACRAGEQRSITDSLDFGTAMPGGSVSQEDWQLFVAEVITPRFPEGLTAWAAAGQWRDATGQLQKEDSYVLHVVHPDQPTYDAAVREVTAIYKERFQQEAVLRVRTPSCISF